ncbi:MAG TPA: cysteine desulfurase family protein [Mycobacteriales bacterium]|nr:cysteine desulfurase family protein [Mycobacteriales bacterium]
MAYLDHAATTPLRPEAFAAISAVLGRTRNASSLHASGRAARRVVEEAREQLAAGLGARPSEVVFTSGGTESDNLAVKGLFWAARAADPRRTRILCSTVEHHAVLDAVQWLVDSADAQVSWLPVDELGRLNPEVLAAELGRYPGQVALVTCMWANNEVGTVQPVVELARLTRAAGAPFHTDAVQALGQLPVDFAASGADVMTVTAHKVGGPVGVGALLLRPGVAITPLTHGGGQERDVRSGTLDPVGATGFAAAVTAAVEDLDGYAADLGGLRDRLVAGVLREVPEAVLGGDPDLRAGPDAGRLPGNAHLSFPGCEGDALLMLLDARGVECSTGSACSAGVARPSHVLLAMGADPAAARSSLRFSLGHTTTASDVDAAVNAIGPAVERARRAGALARARD